MDADCIEICQGPECGEYGGPELLATLQAGGCNARPGHCQGLCHYAPVATLDHHSIGDATPEKVMAKWRQ